MIDIRHGDCVRVMQAMEDACVDAIVTDPPYELGFNAILIEREAEYVAMIHGRLDALRSEAPLVAGL